MSESSVSGSSSQSKSLMYMMVGFFVGIVILLSVGFLLVHRVMQTVGLAAASTNGNTVRTSSGSYRFEKPDQLGPALPAYPRATLELPAMSDGATAIKEAHQGVTVSTYHTTDAHDFVETWYSQHLTSEFKRREAGDKAFADILKGAKVADNDAVFVAERGSRTRILALSEDQGGTQILLIRVDAPTPEDKQP